ncbi:class I SAM-dependent methyltransferase [Streptomyces sp. NBC_00654]|uniref:class I SAM-dependent methyltransferase n=1 Tax=Streptomyces sp. NBC_00654 TaxID=2975799 RepID=UPI002251A599|nr:class I SAM-dependent methyltransferase [Streptomyces sp. NBC_00654]MCX4966417.1 class I SAM-dependent methyltransferase [Streptomyces sp. NBC_00654]
MKSELETAASNIVRSMHSRLQSNGIRIHEGSSSVHQIADLMHMAEDESIERIAEVGFHAGLSSFAFLGANKRATVTSFDIGFHECVPRAKEFVDEEFPGRHELVIGDSGRTLPTYREFHPDAAFDLVFVDGGHSLDEARSDIENLVRMCRKGAKIIMDDIVPEWPWGVGPTEAWEKATASGKVREIARHFAEPSTDVFLNLLAPGPETRPVSHCWAIGVVQ